MSVKAMALVWDLECPSTINGTEFKHGHKFILLAYADHADHFGRNMFPAVPTIAKKTGYKDRNVQLLTHDLEKMGILIKSGKGPRGSARWNLSVDSGGAKITPVQKTAFPSGAKASGAKFTPESEPKPINKYTAPTLDEIEQMGIPEILKQPEIRLFKNVTGRIPGQPQWTLIVEFVRKNQPSEDALRSCWKAWNKQGYRTNSLGWMDWIVAGIPDFSFKKNGNGRKNGNGHKNGNGQPKAPSDEDSEWERNYKAQRAALGSSWET